MRKREYVDYLRDMLDAAEKAERFVAHMDFETFQKDDKTVFAIIRALEVIGEAAKKIPASIKKKYSDIPWPDIAGMRDKLIHEYFGVNLQLVFDTVKKDLPPLRVTVSRMLEEAEGKQGRLHSP